MTELEKSKKYKQFGLTTASVKNKITVYVLTAIILIGGLISYNSMPKESFPEVIVPEIYVGTGYPGNSPLDIERLITRPLEKEINTISGIDEINSSSIQGYSSIQVKFDFEVTPTEALRKVKDKVDIAMSDPDFPTDLPADPNIFEMNFSELVPIMNINLSGNYSMDQLHDYAEYLEDKIEELPQITKVDIRGYQEKEVEISVNLPKMESLEISFNDIANAIRNENVTISGGDLLIDNYKRNVRVIGEFSNMQEIENVIIKQENQDVVYLKDVANVYFRGEDPESFARQYMQPVIMLDVIKRAGENLIAASDDINVIIEKAKKDYFPSDLQLSITNDQSDQTRTQVDELENSIIFGVILVVAVLLFFLGLRNALFVGVAIPLSMFTSFIILSAIGATLNMMVLFSLVLALGMLVDNGIVVVENIYRLMDEGMSSTKAAIYGVGQVAWPIIASTATTLAAFFPLAIWPGLMGQFMKFLPITLITVLASSLFVALVINPVLTAALMKVEEEFKSKGYWIKRSLIFFGIGILFDLMGFLTFGNLLIIVGILILLNAFILNPATRHFQTRIIPALERWYKKTLAYALAKRRPYYLFGGTFGLLIFSFILLGMFTPKVIFFPINQPQYLNIYIEMPIGTDINTTNEATKKIEQEVINMMKKYEDEDGNNFLVESVIGQVGAGTSDPNEGPSMGNTPHKARITVQFVKFQDRRGVITSEVMEDVRAALSSYPGVQVIVAKNSDGPPQGAPINIELKGDDYQQLVDEAEAIKTYINQGNIYGIEELKLDVEQGKPEMPIIIDRQKSRRLNVSTYQIGDALRTALFGKEVSTYKDGEDDYPINIRFDSTYRYDLDALMNQKITFRDQTSGKIRQVPVSAVAEARKTSTFSTVKRKDLTRVVTITSNVLEDANPNEVVQKIKRRLQDYEIPEGNSLSFTGQQEEQAKEMAFLSNALMIAVFLIFLIMVSQFNSGITPFIILISVVFSLIGVLLGLVIFQMDFVIIMTMIGIISLAGIVVNNAIVLIDYINLIMDRKREESELDENARLPIAEVLDSIIEGGQKRLRPVLLTAITTILGLLPLAVGLNINFFTLLSEFNPQIYMGGDNVIFWGPMSWTIIFGLSFATFLTLVIVPVMYYLFHRAKYRLIKVKS
ncbi:MAG: copper transporter [Flavobacteriales bacterium]|nr:copper transporter [Flavobacteriales bacterium]